MTHRFLPSLRKRRGTARRRPARSGGFTLIEATLATVIVATAVLALMEAQEAYHRKNTFAVRQNTAQLLANEIRELVKHWPLVDPQEPGNGPDILDDREDPDDPTTWDDLDDLIPGFSDGAILRASMPRIFGAGEDGQIGPINALGLPIPELSQYTQRVTVNRVLQYNLQEPVPFEGTKDPDVDDPPVRSPEVYRVTVSVDYRRTPDESAISLTTFSWLQFRIR